MIRDRNGREAAAPSGQDKLLARLSMLSMVTGKHTASTWMHAQNSFAARHMCCQRFSIRRVIVNGQDISPGMLPAVIINNRSCTIQRANHMVQRLCMSLLHGISQNFLNAP